MHHTKLFTLSTVFAVATIMHTSNTYAMDITVTPDGTIELYAESVLGMDSENTEQPGRYPTKVLPSSNNQQIRVSPNGERISVETIQKNRNLNQVMERTETDRLRLNVPARQTEEQRRLEMVKQRTAKSDTSVMELERQVGEQAEERELELRKLSPEQREERKLFYEKQKEERQERREERLELKNTIGPDGQEFSLESRGIRAALRNKAVTIDPETNSLILTTKDGEQRVLTTLPDQAVERMLEVRGLSGIDAEKVEIEERDGKLHYVTKAKRAKKLFGLFNRTIDTELTVDDESGEISETLEEKPTSIGRFLDRLSF